MHTAKQKGYTLVEIMIVLALIIGLTTLGLQKLKAETEKTQAAAAGSELIMVSDWLGQYLKKNVTLLQGQIDPNCIPIATPLICKLNTQSLVTQGFASVGWDGFNIATRSPYHVYIELVPPTGALSSIQEYNLQAYLQTENGWLSGGSSGEPNLALARLAANAAGNIGGVTEGGAASGTNGSWTLPAGKYPGMTSAQLTTLIQFQAQALASYLPLNGSRAMVGDLELNGYRLNNAQDIMINGNNMKRRMVSSMMPNWVFKGAYGVTDFDADPGGGSVPIPVCPDSANGVGTPKILITMSSLYNERFGGYSAGLPAQNPSTAVSSMSGAYGAWNFYALEDPSNGIWRTYVRRFYDNGYIPGEGMASVYCFYP